MSKGGFDVVIGNPPYVSTIAKLHIPLPLATEKSGFRHIWTHFVEVNDTY